MVTPTMVRPAIALLASLLLLGCANVDPGPAEETHVEITIGPTDGPGQTFAVDASGVQCRHREPFFDLVVTPVEGGSERFFLKLAPLGTGRFTPDGEALIQESGTFSCTEPCVRLMWVAEESGVASSRSNAPCYVDLVEETLGWRGSFRCDEMGAEVLWNMHGELYCSKDDLVTVD